MRQLRRGKQTEEPQGLVQAKANPALRGMPRFGEVQSMPGNGEAGASTVGVVLYLAMTAAFAAEPAHALQPPAPTSAAPNSEVTAIALPGAPPDGVWLDYLAVDRARNRVWVPAGGTGNTVVIDARTQEIRRIEQFPTAEVERRGQKRMVGPTSATVGDGVVYVGNRGDSSVCAVDAATLARGGCVTIPSMPDGLAFVARTKEVWVATPRDQSIVILDVSTPAAPKLAGSVKLEGDPEGYAVDDGRGLFYTNLEDRDRTLRIDVSTRKVTATWMPACGEEGPRGLAIETKDQLLMVACPEHVEVLAAATDGRILSKLDTGAGVDNIDYLPRSRALYAAAAGAATLTIAGLEESGTLRQIASRGTAKGARNAVVTDDGIAYVADGPDGKVLIVRTAKVE
jgi:putative pyrroloquinoline-quinone-binding quinoprotein